MLRLLIVLVVGLVIGYSFGFKDAKTHNKNIAVRMLDRAGGSTRDKVGSDVDKKMEQLERP
jgi:hypothetical protein